MANNPHQPYLIYQVDLEPLRKAITQFNLMHIWRDSITELSDEERRERGKDKALCARDAYIRLMTSKKNNGTLEYREWAIKTALGLRTSKRHTAQPIGGKNWRAWGSR